MEETWSPEPVKAWRYWHVQRCWNFETHRWEANLTGTVEEWDSAIKIAIHKGGADHPSPNFGCPCGVNAVKRPAFADLREWFKAGACWDCFTHKHDYHPVAIGEVALSGVVDEYERGYRAEKAEILRLVVIAEDPRIADAVQLCYGVPVSAETYDGPFMVNLWKEEADGHREADTSDHRGTGTGKATRTNKRTSQNWLDPDWFDGPLGALASILAAVALVAVGVFVLYALAGGFDPEKIAALKAPWAK